MIYLANVDEVDLVNNDNPFIKEVEDYAKNDGHSLYLCVLR